MARMAFSATSHEICGRCANRSANCAVASVLRLASKSVLGSQSDRPARQHADKDGRANAADAGCPGSVLGLLDLLATNDPEPVTALGGDLREALAARQRIVSDRLPQEGGGPVGGPLRVRGPDQPSMPRRTRIVRLAPKAYESTADSVGGTSGRVRRPVLYQRHAAGACAERPEGSSATPPFGSGWLILCLKRKRTKPSEKVRPLPAGPAAGRDAGVRPMRCPRRPMSVGLRQQELSSLYH
jgi:hypothetical protein